VEIIWATVGFYSGFNSEVFSTKTQALEMLNNESFGNVDLGFNEVNNSIWIALEKNVKLGGIVAKVNAG
jgi:hypothetical protein